MKVPDDLQKEHTTYLKCPEYSANCAKILKNLSPSDRVELCQIVGIAVPKVYPLLWTRQRHKLGEFEDFIHPKLRDSTIRCLLKEKSNLLLPKRIVISYKGYTAYFGPTLTKISEFYIEKMGFILSELDHHFVISHKLVISYKVPTQSTSERCEENSQRILSDLHQTEITEDNVENGNNYMSTYVQNNDQRNYIDRLDAIDSHVGMQVDGSFDDHLSNTSVVDFQPNLNSTVLLTGENRNTENDLNEENVDLPDRGYEEQYESVEVDISMAPEVSTNTQNNNTLKDQSNCTANTQKTLPKQKIKYMNIYQNPLQLSNEDFCTLIHCKKEQFVEFVNTLRPYYHQVDSESHLSLISRAFLFRMKIASYESDARLGVYFSVDKKTANNIYWNIMEITYRYNLQIPDFLDIKLNVDELFSQMAELQDTFFTKLVEPIKDPKGKCLK